MQIEILMMVNYFIFSSIFFVYSILNTIFCSYLIYKGSPPGYGIGFVYTFGFFIPSILYFLNLITSSFRSYLGYSKFEDFNSFIKSKSFYVSLFLFTISVLSTSILFFLPKRH